MNRSLSIFFVFTLLASLPTTGCDRGAINSTGLSDIETTSFPSFHITSGSSLSPESKQARDLRGFLKQKRKISHENVTWDQLKIMKTKFEESQKLVDVVVAPLQKATLSSSPISVPSKDGYAKDLRVEHSQLVYLPSLNKGFTTEWHFKTADKATPASQNGYVRFKMSGNQFTYEVSDGWPVKQVSNASSLSKQEDEDDDCLDGPNCSTGECYKTAKDACDSDGECKLLCDALDFAGGSCSLSIAAACFYLNAVE